MVLIDTMFPDELGLDRYLDPEVRFIAYREDDACCTLERISQYDLIKGVQRYIGKEPSIPVVYLASEQEPAVVDGRCDLDPAGGRRATLQAVQASKEFIGLAAELSILGGLHLLQKRTGSLRIALA